MAARPPYRIYGQVWGLPEAARAELLATLPFERAAFEDDCLVLEHEGGFIDVEEALEAIAAALGEGGEGYVDSIDNDAWTVTRYQVIPGSYAGQTYSADDVLEHVKGEGNF